MKSLLYKRPADAPILCWGRTHEDDARKTYLHLVAEAVTMRSCLVINLGNLCLACSPDNIVTLSNGEQGLVEYKCPYKDAQQSLSPEQAALQLRDFCSILNSEGQLQLSVCMHISTKSKVLWQSQANCGVTSCSRH